MSTAAHATQRARDAKALNSSRRGAVKILALQGIMSLGDGAQKEGCAMPGFAILVVELAAESARFNLR